MLLFSFFLITNFLIPAVIQQILNPISELAIPIGIPTKKRKQKLKHIQ